ncbi:MAG: hypothetical protein IBX72_10150 [Nitrospirae bacterium]|nr:hypothetical protein [Nitrospirota bacterium]
MEEFKVFYDEEEDILYLAKEGDGAEVVEISPLKFDFLNEIIIPGTP